jgi:hypothetical protein
MVPYSATNTNPSGCCCTDHNCTQHRVIIVYRSTDCAVSPPPPEILQLQEEATKAKALAASRRIKTRAGWIPRTRKLDSVLRATIRDYHRRPGRPCRRLGRAGAVKEEKCVT